MNQIPRKFPFVPKTTRALEPGDFWAVPLSDGTFACGRVLQSGFHLTPRKTKAFWGCLIDWHGNSRPTNDSIAGCGIVREGQMHLLAITSTGGSVEGNRALSLDGIHLRETVSAGTVYSGFDVITTAHDKDYEVLMAHSTWGYSFIQVLAEAKFVKGTYRTESGKAIDPMKLR